MAADLSFFFSPQHHWCAITFFNPSKLFLKGNLCGADCCKSCSSLNRMRRSVEKGNALDVPFRLCAQSRGQDAVLWPSGCFCCCASCLTLSSICLVADSSLCHRLYHVTHGCRFRCWNLNATWCAISPFNPSDRLLRMDSVVPNVARAADFLLKWDILAETSNACRRSRRLSAQLQDKALSFGLIVILLLRLRLTLLFNFAGKLSCSSSRTLHIDLLRCLCLDCRSGVSICPLLGGLHQRLHQAAHGCCF